MPVTVPVLDDRTFEQLLDDARARIPSFTPEWNNFGLDGDPGITLVQVFAFLTDALLYRVNRYPEANRLKFLQLLGIPLKPAAPASGIIAVSNDRGPLMPLPLEQNIQVAAGNVDFVTSGPMNVLPLEGQIYFKKRIDATDPGYAKFEMQYEAIRLAAEAAATADGDAGAAAGAAGSSAQLVFYETKKMEAPTPANPALAVDFVSDTLDSALYIALLAPVNATPADVLPVIANQTLSIGVVPAIAGDVPPLWPLQVSTRTTPLSQLTFEIPSNFGTNMSEAQYVALSPLAAPNVLDAIGVVQLPLPGAQSIGTWTFTDPMGEGTGDFPPKIEDTSISQRIVTWVRMRLALPSPANGASVVPSAKLTWTGINAATVYQAVSIVNEFVANANGEPDQSYALANSPILPSTLTVIIQDTTAALPVQWGQVEDLLSAKPNDMVFSVDPEAAQIVFGDGIHGARPPAGTSIIANYQYGGGRQGNVGIGAINSSRDPRLQGGYSIKNPVPTTSGASGQTVDEANKTIPQVIRHKERLVTAQDFADVIIQTPGVDINRVDVLPLFNPGPPPLNDVPGVVTLMVVPAVDPVNPLWPMPDRLFLRRICDYIDPRRLVTTEVYVRGPEYVPVYVTMGIAVQAGYFPDLVIQAVTAALKTYLSSLRTLGATGGGWPLRKQLLSKDLEAAATRVEGVEFVDSLQLGVKDATPVTQYDLTGLQLPRLDGLSVVEGVAKPLANLLGTVVRPAQPGVNFVPVPVIKAKC